MKTKIFYNNKCDICNKEINIYKKFSGKNLVFIKIFANKTDNISSSEKEKLLRRLHVTSNNKNYIGAEAFLEIWKNIPKFYFIYKIFKNPPLLFSLKIMYEFVSFFLFLKNKHLLKKK
tara:strand:+ start:13834 stop:14187 length:354 start_codon:yes stop_codon:yes gene_type:complete